MVQTPPPFPAAKPPIPQPRSSVSFLCFCFLHAYHARNILIFTSLDSDTSTHAYIHTYIHVFPSRRHSIAVCIAHKVKMGAAVHYFLILSMSGSSHPSCIFTCLLSAAIGAFFEFWVLPQPQTRRIVTGDIVKLCVYICILSPYSFLSFLLLFLPPRHHPPPPPSPVNPLSCGGACLRHSALAYL